MHTTRETMLDHVTISVSDLEYSRAFYDAALKPLGITRVYDGEVNFLGYGTPEKAFFWIGFRNEAAITSSHIAFATQDRKIVDAFYHAALLAGGKDNGPPGLRPHYHEDYYGAFILDPDGHNIEAVCHDAGDAPV
jgi:catechol 2,3-dioxygenase-like lactoylglutathione lyase family enzyme